MRLLLVTFWNFDDANVNGIAKKILAEKAAFTKLGFEVDLTCCRDGGFYWTRGETSERLCSTRRYTTRIFAARALARALHRAGAGYDCAYIRYAQSDGGLLALVKELHRQNTRTVVEIPTYPYEQEFQHGLLKASLLLDRAYRNRVAEHIGRFVIYTNYDTVFGVKTIRTKNGVDASSVPVAATPDCGPGAPIRLIAVAGFAPWHGYDRLLRGLADYKSRGGKRTFFLNLVGDGAERPRYEALVKALSLTDWVRFSGFLGGGALNAAYGEAHIAVASLGMSRIGLPYSTSLKFFEYLVRGLPTVTVGRGENNPALADCTLRIPCDESPVDCFALEAFYDRIYGSGPDPALRKRIRALAEPLCSMESTLLPVRSYFDGEASL